MLTLPGAMAVTMPVSDPTVATEVLLLDHVPYGEALLSVELLPTHALAVPDMLPGATFTVIWVVATHAPLV